VRNTANATALYMESFVAPLTQDPMSLVGLPRRSGAGRDGTSAIRRAMCAPKCVREHPSVRSWGLRGQWEVGRG